MGPVRRVALRIVRKLSRLVGRNDLFEKPGERRPVEEPAAGGKRGEPDA